MTLRGTKWISTCLSLVKARIDRCMCMYTHTCTCGYLRVEARSQPQMSFCRYCPLSFWDSVSYQPRTHQVGKTGRSVRPRDSPVSVSSVLGLQECSLYCASLHRSRGSNSDPHVCMTNFLLTELSSQTYIYFSHDIWSTALVSMHPSGEEESNCRTTKGPCN